MSRSLNLKVKSYLGSPSIKSEKYSFLPAKRIVRISTVVLVSFTLAACSSSSKSENDAASKNVAITKSLWKCESISTDVGDKLRECTNSYKEISDAKYPVNAEIHIGCGNGMTLYSALSITAENFLIAWKDSPASVQFDDLTKQEVWLDTNGASSNDFVHPNFFNEDKQSNAKILATALNTAKEMGLQATDLTGRVWSFRMPVTGFETAAEDLTSAGCEVLGSFS